MILASILRQLIHDRGTNAIQVARATGVPKSTIANWIAGQSPRNFKQLKKVATHFSVSLDYLLFGPDDSERSPIHPYKDEVIAGVYEIILRPVKREKEEA